MNRLAPLVVGLLVAVTAVFGGENAARIDELAIGGHGVRREEGGFLAEGVVVAEGYGVVELGGGAGDVDVGGVGGGGQVGATDAAGAGDCDWRTPGCGGDRIGGGADRKIDREREGQEGIR